MQQTIVPGFITTAPAGQQLDCVVPQPYGVLMMQ
jgi:hypothetical protein